MNKITSMKQDRLSIKLKRFKLNEADESEEDEQNSDDNDKTEDKGLFVFFSVCPEAVLTHNIFQYNY